jgi:hypothetical protein
MRRVPCSLLLMTALATTLAGAEAVPPETVAGLVARYEVETLHLRLGEGAAIESWADSSGNGRDLRFAGNGLPARLRTQRVNKRPAVELRKGGSYLVAKPFDLADHTIFLVHRVVYSERALFASEADPARGVALHVDGKQHVVRTGAIGAEAQAYTSAAPASAEFGLTVLGREAGRLRAFVDGVEVSSAAQLEPPLRVGEFFRLVLSRFVDRDAEGLEIAEMLFYDRFLPAEKRTGVSEFLVERYGLAERMGRVDRLAERLDALRGNRGSPVLWLGTEAPIDLNLLDDVAAVAWTVRERVDPPFGHEPGENATRIGCARDGTLVRLYVRLGLVGRSPGSNVRLLLLRSGGDYHPDDAISGEFGGEGEAGQSQVELETTVLLDAGEWVEVVTQGIGERGEVRLDPARTLVAGETR